MDIGVIGGFNTVLASSRIVQAKLWPILNTGRVLLDLFESKFTRERCNRDTFRLMVAKRILGVSKRAPSEGVLAELGWKQMLHKRILNY